MVSGDTMLSRSSFPVISANSAAYLSALSLIAIQVCIGIILKSSQTDGAYAFSVSGSVTISEFFKCILSGFFVLRECWAKLSSQGRGHSLLPSSPRSASSEDLSLEELFEEEKIDENSFSNSPFDLYQGRSAYQLFRLRIDEVSVDSQYGFALLALLYALINNSIFVAYKLADPGTIAITRSGVIFITAIVMVFTLGTKVSKVQWIAVVIQLCGLMTTQYRPGIGTSYPLYTYAVLMGLVFVSSVSGVYNQALLKRDKASLHAQNAVLYAAGTAINMLIHITLRMINSTEPSFFVGYTTWSAIAVIISNIFIGIAITAVYKYANAVVKCLASAVATGILLYLSPILFGTEMAPLTIPGGAIVFISSWLYMDSPPPKENVVELKEDPSYSKPQPSKSQSTWRNVTVLITSAVATIFIIASLEVIDFPTPDNGDRSPASNFHGSGGNIVQSPFRSTLAYIRFNAFRPERLDYIKKYQPFFHDIHYSMPGITGDPNMLNTTHDGWENQLAPYLAMADTMQHILDQPKGSSESKINGIMYFHFDAWLKPLDFGSEDFSKIWMAHSRSEDGQGGGPTAVCMTDRKRFPAWLGLHSDENWHYSILTSLEILKAANASYSFNPGEWCTGWSDFYYIPRHLFVDYIYLSAFFGATNSFHELAVPTIVHIIDQSRRKNSWTSIMNWIGDCYGGCCNRKSNMEQYNAARCGHVMDFTAKAGVVESQFSQLDKAAATLGKPCPAPEWVKGPDAQRDWTVFTKYLPQAALDAYETISGYRPENEYQWRNSPDRIPFNANGKETNSPYQYWYARKPPRPLNLTEQAMDDAHEEELHQAQLLQNPPTPHSPTGTPKYKHYISKIDELSAAGPTSPAKNEGDLSLLKSADGVEESLLSLAEPAAGVPVNGKKPPLL